MSQENEETCDNRGTFKKWFSFLEVPHKGEEKPSFLRNDDLLPIRKEDQTWGFWSNFAYWGILSFNVGTWMAASSALTYGLSYADIIGAFILGDVVTIIFTLANSYPGCDWKVGYTVTQRLVFGIYGSAIGVCVRVLVSIVNYGSTAWVGGLCVNIVLDSWSDKYLNMKNTLPSNVNMTSKELIGFAIFHLITIFFYFMKPRKMNYVLIWSCAACGISMLGMVIYLCTKAGGAGSSFSAPATIHGSQWSWMFCYMISYWFGSVSPGSTNQSDYSRFSSNKTGLWLGTIIALLIPTTIVPIFGVLGASASKQLYDQNFWMPTDILEHWMIDGYSSGARAASFFCGLSFMFTQIGYAINACGFAAGMDLSGLLPKYINIIRGAIFTALLSWAVQPWNFYNSNSTFLTVVSSFGVIMTPIISVMIADNFLVHKRRYAISEVFKLKGEYYYSYGFNWRAIIASICGIAPGIPGIIWQVDQDAFNDNGIVNFYYADSFTSFAISFFLYWVLCILFPFKIGKEQDEEDYYGSFTKEVAIKKGMIPYDDSKDISFTDVEPIDRKKNTHKS
ncbi:THI7 [Brettanomyces bruxellensis]|uniref:DEBR0S2_20846g1_1 n=1 Tax=Dekkera bruxellensis TaxID=5007 RepID=A0A7D9GZC8_DEKBR|nr:THI7 [Brettanomyces bruxellensis]